MPLQPPPGQNYMSPLVATPCPVLDPPQEGNQQVSLEIDWGSMGIKTGALTSVYVNLQNSATMNFSQVCAMKVDNSACGGDVQIIFQQTMDTTDVAAYEPAAIFPVFTGSVQFYIVANGAGVSDVTRIQVFNFLPPPVALPLSVEQNQAQVSGLPVGNVPVSKQIVPAGVNGTLEFIQLSLVLAAAPAALSQAQVAIEDGAGNYLVNTLTVTAGPNTATTSGTIILNLTDLRWRFTNGVALQWLAPSGGWSNAGILNCTAGYRAP